jgi:hypothetical protein
MQTRAVEWFIAFSMCVLAILKLQNIDSFSSMFLGYDLFAKRWVPYSPLGGISPSSNFFSRSTCSPRTLSVTVAIPANPSLA